MKKSILLLSTILLFSCGNNNSSNNDTSNNSPTITQKVSKDLIIGQTLSTDYFDVTISDVAIGNRVNTNNQFTDISPEKDNMFMVFFVKFKNTDNESHYIDEGTILINNGKDFKFEKSETIMLEGWGILLDELNPLTTMDTKIVYKLPKEINGKVYWVSDDNDRIYLGEISNQKITLSNENPKEVVMEKEVEKVEVVETETESQGLPTEEEVIEEKSIDAPQITYYKINDPDGYSNLRDAPKGEIVRKVLESEKFEVISTEDGYKKVKLYDGTTGYIHNSRVVKY